MVPIYGFFQLNISFDLDAESRAAWEQCNCPYREPLLPLKGPCYYDDSECLIGLAERGIACNASYSPPFALNKSSEECDW
eukprot:COSAG05_NODE_6469_length_952_cov_1.304807_2_plen_80_part_00